ncbi:MAG: hypothetical protein ACH0QD_13500 [Tepidibacillus sp.]
MSYGYDKLREYIKEHQNVDIDAYDRIVVEKLNQNGDVIERQELDHKIYHAMFDVEQQIELKAKLNSGLSISLVLNLIFYISFTQKMISLLWNF